MRALSGLLEAVRNLRQPRSLSIEGLNPNKFFKFYYQTPNGYGLSIDGKLRGFTRKGLNITLQIEDTKGELIQIITQKVVAHKLRRN